MNSGIKNPAGVKVSKSTYKLALWARQLATLLKASVPLVRSLEVLTQQCEDPLLREVHQDVAKRIDNGIPFSKALSTYPRVFSKVFVGLVRSGETSGQLNECLDRLATMLERETTLQQRLTSALTYPAFVLTVTIVLTLFVFYSILPNFISIFRDQHLELPFITKVLIFITEGVRNPGAWAVVVGLLLALYVLVQQMASTQAGTVRLYQFVVSVPILGASLRLAGLARFCWVLESVLGSGLPLLRCIQMASSACGSPIIEQDRPHLTAYISEGHPMSEYLRGQVKIYHHLMGHMVAAGEESARLQESFSHLASWFNLEMEERLELMSATIEPLLMSFVAVIVGMIVVGIFLPLYGLVSNLGT